MSAATQADVLLCEVKHGVSAVLKSGVESCTVIVTGKIVARDPQEQKLSSV